MTRNICVECLIVKEIWENWSFGEIWKIIAHISWIFEIFGMLKEFEKLGWIKNRNKVSECRYTFLSNLLKQLNILWLIYIFDILKRFRPLKSMKEQFSVKKKQHTNYKNTPKVAIINTIRVNALILFVFCCWRLHP